MPVTSPGIVASGPRRPRRAGLALGGAQAPTVYNDVVSIDNPAGHYKMAETSGTTLTARVGPIGTISASGVAYGVAGLAANNGGDNALSFLRPSGTTGGYAEVAQVAAEAAFDGTGSFTHECWLTPLSDTARSSNQNLLNRSSYGMYLTADNKPCCFTGSNNYTAAAALMAGTKYHLAHTFNGTTHTVAVNGVSVISVVDSIVTGGALGIAEYPGPFDTANVTMDEVAVYKGWLSLARLAAHYASGVAA